MAQAGQENKFVVFFLSDKHGNLQQLFSLYTYIKKLFKCSGSNRLLRFSTDFFGLIVT